MDVGVRENMILCTSLFIVNMALTPMEGLYSNAEFATKRSKNMIFLKMQSRRSVFDVILGNL